MSIVSDLRDEILKESQSLTALAESTRRALNRTATAKEANVLACRFDAYQKVEAMKVLLDQLDSLSWRLTVEQFSDEAPSDRRK